MRTTAALAVVLALSLSATPSMAKGSHVMDGKASWYSLPGQKMANGVRMNPRLVTVAHKTLPLGTKVCITNLENGITVKNIPVTDRGPYVRGRVFDASKALGIKLGLIPKGYARVHGWIC